MPYDFLLDRASGKMHISGMTTDDVRKMMLDACDAAGSAAAWAAKHGISRAYVTDVRLGRREPGAKILAALGVVKDVTYRAARTAASTKEQTND